MVNALCHLMVWSLQSDGYWEHSSVVIFDQILPRNPSVVLASSVNAETFATEQLIYSDAAAVFSAMLP